MTISKTLDKVEENLKSLITKRSGVPAKNITVQHVTAPEKLNLNALTKPVVKQPTRDIRPRPAMPLKHPIKNGVGMKASAKATKVGATKTVKAVKKVEAAEDYAITVLVKANPKREGTPSYDRFELYKKHKTASSFKTAGGTAADLKWDASHGFISLK